MTTTTTTTGRLRAVHAPAAARPALVQRRDALVLTAHGDSGATMARTAIAAVTGQRWNPTTIGVRLMGEATGWLTAYPVDRVVVTDARFTGPNEARFLTALAHAGTTVDLLLADGRPNPRLTTHCDVDWEAWLSEPDTHADHQSTPACGRPTPPGMRPDDGTFTIPTSTCTTFLMDCKDALDAHDYRRLHTTFTAAYDDATPSRGLPRHPLRSRVIDDLVRVTEHLADPDDALAAARGVQAAWLYHAGLRVTVPTHAIIALASTGDDAMTPQRWAAVPAFATPHAAATTVLTEHGHDPAHVAALTVRDYRRAHAHATKHGLDPHAAAALRHATPRCA